MLPSLATLRKEYSAAILDIAQTTDEPVAQFGRWFTEAQQAQLPEPNAMHLSTVSAQGRPSGRIVLLKGMDERGFVFFTNYESRKGQEIAANPYVSLTFFWPELERQVRIEGRVEKVSDSESEAYFHSRPRGSQLGAAASPQSQVITGRQVLEKKMAEMDAQFGETSIIPRPAHWGGYRVTPDAVEFWQGRLSRLHDRIQYTKRDDQWVKQRLAP